MAPNQTRKRSADVDSNIEENHPAKKYIIPYAPAYKGHIPKDIPVYVPGPLGSQKKRNPNQLEYMPRSLTPMARNRPSYRPTPIDRLEWNYRSQEWQTKCQDVNKIIQKLDQEA